MSLIASAAAMQYYNRKVPDARARALDATSTDPWGPSHALMQEVFADTLTRHSADVFHVLRDALHSSGSQWRRSHKALVTIAYCLRQGSKEVLLFAQAHKSVISQLTRFEFFDAYRLDRGAAIREEASAIISMLQHGITPSTSSTIPSAFTHQHRPATHHSRSDPTPLPASRPVQTLSLFPVSNFREVAVSSPLPKEDAICDTQRLSYLIKRLESSAEDEYAWLNVYKLLFLLQNELANASNSIIRYWTQHAHLFAHLRTLQSSGRTAAELEVRRLAGELAEVFGGGERPSEIRRRASMF